MKIKHIVMAFALVMVGAFISVLAKNHFQDLTSLMWIANAAQPLRLNSATSTVASPLAVAVHDPHNPTSGQFRSALKKAQVTQHQDGDIVIIMTTEEDEAHQHEGSSHSNSGPVHNLPGTLTLKLRRDAAGTTITGGEWAFNVSYTKVVHIENPEPGGEDHAEFLVQRGTIKGTINGGQTTLDGDGAVSAINSVQLTINGGSLTFHDAHSGTGNGYATNVQNADQATGELNLNIPHAH